MRIALLVFLSLPLVVTDAVTTTELRRQLQGDGSSSAPTPATIDGETTVAPTEADFGIGGDAPAVAPTVDNLVPTVDIGEDEVPVPVPDEDTTPFPSDEEVETLDPSISGGTETPTEGSGEETPAPETPTGGLGEETPMPVNNVNTPAPVYTDLPVDAPTASEPYEPPSPVMAPVAEPTSGYVPYPEYKTPAPSPRPEATYISNDDDPLPPLNPEGTKDGSWGWNDSTVEELEHDRTVIIALSVVFGIGICFAVITAQQILENPHGCWSSICRILAACSCAITRCVCFPCRALCGCTNSDRRTHDIMIQDNSDYTHDLELS